MFGDMFGDVCMFGDMSILWLETSVAVTAEEEMEQVWLLPLFLPPIKEKALGDCGVACQNWECRSNFP